MAALAGGVPFGQRFTGRFVADGTTIDGRWETKTADRWETDFALVSTRVR